MQVPAGMEDIASQVIAQKQGANLGHPAFSFRTRELSRRMRGARLL
jgi:hypothetical protein